MARPRKPSRDDRAHISISAECWERLKRAADDRGVTMASIVEERINAFLDRKGQQ